MPPSKHQPNILRGPGDYEVTTRVYNDTYPEIDPRSISLSGKAVFISGGSRGIGRAMAISFAQAGASKIAVGARSALDEVEKDIRNVSGHSPAFLAVKLDVTDETSVADAAKKVESEFGSLNVVVNCAGILGQYGLIADSSPDSWWQVLQVNLQGPYLVTRAFLPLLLKAEPDAEKYIVNVCSVATHLTNPRLSAYQVSKSGLFKLTALTNAEYADQGITTFAIHPGNVPTDIMGGPAAIPPHHKHELAGHSVVYLVSEKRTWLGGRYINCTWDLPELVSKEAEIVRGDKLKNKFDFELGTVVC